MAAIAMINAAVAKALYDTQLETLENFKKYLSEKDDVDMEFMEELIGGFKATLQAPKVPAAGKGKGKGGKKAESEDGGEKKKRAPSAYTMYIQYEMQHLKKDYPEIKSGKELMAKAVEAWGELTEENKSELKKMLKENPSLTSEQLVTRVLGGAKAEADVASEPESDADSEAPAEPEATESETEKKSPLRAGFGGATSRTKKAPGQKKAGKK